MPHVLISGGAGFIGSHLCERLLAAGHQVICLDNFSTGSRTNLRPFADNPNFRLIETDLTAPIDSWAADIPKLAAVYHFASPASPNPDSPVSYLNLSLETLMVNSVGTRHLLELANQSGCQIILASTSEVYGDPQIHPQPETYWGNVSPNGPRSCYDEGKRFLEAIAFAYYRKHQTKIKVIRIFNTYGPRMRLDDGRFVPTLADSLLHGKPFRRFGDGSSTRSFCYVTDLIDGILAVADSDRAVGEVINLGNPEEITLNQAILVAEQVSGASLRIEARPALPDDPLRRCPDITKAKELLGWEPQIAFRDGFQRLLESYR